MVNRFLCLDSTVDTSAIKVRMCMEVQRCKRHAILLKDPQMRDRINLFIDAITDVFAHHQDALLPHILTQCIRNIAVIDEKTIHLLNIKYREVQGMVFHHVQMIFRDHEIHALQGLLKDYKTF